MDILILGGGGREHALAWAFAQNPKCDRLWCAPGNAGIAEEATCVALDILDGDKDWLYALLSYGIPPISIPARLLLETQPSLNEFSDRATRKV
jgi:hypothetical protein